MGAWTSTRADLPNPCRTRYPQKAVGQTGSVNVSMVATAVQEGGEREDVGMDMDTKGDRHLDLETRVPADHPLRTINRLADRALAQLSPEFDRMYARVGRPSIPQERLLKASLLISLYSVRSERAFCQQLDYDLLFR